MLGSRPFLLLVLVALLSPYGSLTAVVAASHPDRLDSRHHLSNTHNNPLRRATSSNQITLHHSPPARGSVWDASTGKLKGRAKNLLHQRWHSHDAVKEKRGLVGGLLKTVSGVLHADYDPGWKVSVVRAENDQQDNEWLVEASYGTPGQPLKVVLDSGSADGYAYSPSCCFSSNHSYFDPKRSSTFSNRTVSSTTGKQTRAAPGTPGTPWNITYGSGRGIAGYLGLDTVQLGSLSVRNTTFALATASSGSSGSGKMEGLIGFAPSRSLDSYYPGGWNDPLEEAVRRQQIPKPYLTATLVEVDRRTGLGGGGRYTFGSLDSDAARSEPTWLNTTSANYWGIAYDSVSVGDVDVDDTQDQYHRMIVDTGTALVLFSETITDQINAQITGSVKEEDEDSDDGDGEDASGAGTSNPWMVPCRTGLPEYEASLPASKRNKPFHITLGGTEFTVPVSRFVFWPLEPRPSTNSNGTSAGQDMCLSSFQPTSAPFAVLGDVFIRGHVVTFDTGAPVPANQTSASAAFTGRRIGVAKRKGEP